jgi:hypothetical protein
MKTGRFTVRAQSAFYYYGYVIYYHKKLSTSIEIERGSYETRRVLDFLKLLPRNINYVLKPTMDANR